MANPTKIANPTKKVWIFVLIIALTVTFAGLYVAYYSVPPVRFSLGATPLVSNSTESKPAHEDAKNCCDVGSLKPWDRRVITELLPPIQKDCQLMKQNNQTEIARVKLAMKNRRRSDTFSEWSASMSNCSNVVEEFTNNFYISPEELEFPLAFTFVVYTSPEQIVRLLKAIYRPHNLYCIHPDASKGEEFAEVFRRLSSCLDNVFVASKLQKVRYDYGVTITNAQLNCLRDLMTFPTQRWMYAINICGRELPAMSNREMVKSLKKLDTVSVIRTSEVDAETMRHRLKWKLELDPSTGQVRRSKTLLGKPPHDIKAYKSMTYIAASRAFARFVLSSKVAKDLYEYMKGVKASEEHFYPSLYHHPGTPGGYNPNIRVPIIDKYKWMWNAPKNSNECTSEIVHGICILSVGELPYIHSTIENLSLDVFFFNKYFMEKDHVVMDCMEERLLQQNLLEYRQDCIHSTMSQGQLA